MCCAACCCERAAANAENACPCRTHVCTCVQLTLARLPRSLVAPRPHCCCCPVGVTAVDHSLCSPQEQQRESPGCHCCCCCWLASTADASAYCCKRGQGGSSRGCSLLIFELLGLLGCLCCCIHMHESCGPAHVGRILPGQPAGCDLTLRFILVAQKLSCKHQTHDTWPTKISQPRRHPGQPKMQAWVGKQHGVAHTAAGVAVVVSVWLTSVARMGCRAGTLQPTVHDLNQQATKCVKRAESGERWGQHISGVLLLPQHT